MNINKLIERELTEVELFTIERFNYYFGGRFNFALIDTRTVVVIEADGDVEQLEKEAKKLMKKCLSRHPDFGSLYMEDKHGITDLLDTVYTISETELSKEEQERESVDFVTALGLREDCRSACKKGQVLAIIEKEKESE